jgi:hypothetical protein
VARGVAQVTLLPLAVPVMLFTFALLLHRAMTEYGRYAQPAHPMPAE